MVLPYYKIERTNEGKEFFYSHIGYFNFWDKYLILRTEELKDKGGIMLVNRGNIKLDGFKMTKGQKLSVRKLIFKVVFLRKSGKMFEDFPELKKYNILHVLAGSIKE